LTREILVYLKCNILHKAWVEIHRDLYDLASLFIPFSTFLIVSSNAACRDFIRGVFRRSSIAYVRARWLYWDAFSEAFRHRHCGVINFAGCDELFATRDGGGFRGTISRKRRSPIRGIGVGAPVSI